MPKHLLRHPEEHTLYAIPLLVWFRLGRVRLLESQLTAIRLAGAYFVYRAKSLDSTETVCSNCLSVFRQFNEVEDDAVHSLLEDHRRNDLLSSIGLFDSFLSDSLRFLFLYWPNALPKDLPEKRKPTEEYPDFVERVVRRSRCFSSQGSRVGFLASEFGVALDAELLEELSRLTSLRNEIVHHSSFYRFVLDPGERGLRSEEKPLPHVAEKDARKLTIIVGDVCDSIYFAMYLKIFGVDPVVRPVNPDLAELHKELRKQWAQEESTPPTVDEYPIPGWAVKVLSDPRMPWVGDELDAWMIMPSGLKLDLDLMPCSISFRWNNRHGMKAWATIDSNPREEIDTHFSSNLLRQMLAGQSILVEYYEKRSDGPKYARFSLDGFAQAWYAARRIREGEGDA